MSKIDPFLWFDSQAEEAAKYYVSIFKKNSKITAVTRYIENMPLPAGTVMTVAFTLRGIQFVALNGGPVFKFSPATSFVINCDDQKEVDHFWNKLGAGGQLQPCGWLTDKFGVTWQVVPKQLGKLLSSKDKAKAQRVAGAMMKMGKLIVADLEAAANEGSKKPAKKRR